MARLRITTGKGQGRAIEVEKSAVIGRGEGVQLQIHDAKASREHCKVFEQAGQWAVADLNSRNGLKVNGVQTTRKTLAHGDRIEIGETVIVFEGGKAAAGSPADTADLPAIQAPGGGAAAARPAAKTGDATAKKEAAMAAARAAAAKSPAAAAKAPAAASAKAPAKAGAATAGDKGMKVSDHVLQYHKIDPKRATVMDVDLTQSPGITKFLVVLACLGFLALVIWFVSTMLETA